MFVKRSLGLSFLLMAVAAVLQAAPKSDAERCRDHAGLDACYDAIRREPRDPVLLISLGDALQRANRPVEAVRAYRRAATLSPNISGLNAKIRVAEAKAVVKPGAARVVAAKPAPAKPTPVKAIVAKPLATVAALQATPGRRFSNADPVAQSH